MIVALSLFASTLAQAQSAPHQSAYPGTPVGSPSLAPQEYGQGADLDSWDSYLGPHNAADAAVFPPYLVGSVSAYETSPARQWFFGAYALHMTRDKPSFRHFALRNDEPSFLFIPSLEDVVLSTGDIEPDATWGAEIRFGSTLRWGADPTGEHRFAWELVYWGLAEDEQAATYSVQPDPGVRLYGSIDYGGLEYNRDGSGPVVWGYDPLILYVTYYNIPGIINTNVSVLGARVRNDFQAQNLELNFLKLPLYGGHATSSPLSVTTVGGVRYLKFDEEFQNAIMFTTINGPGTLPPNNAYPDDPTEFTGFGDDVWNLYHDIEVDNQLVGFQLGANLNWAFARRWDLFCDSMFGLYNNRIDVSQRVTGGGEGVVRFVNDQSPAIVHARKDDLAFMCELRTGVGYQVNSNLRLTAAYRLMTVKGVALALEQIPSDWSSASHVGTIDSNNSLILHGLQLGMELMY